MEAGRVRAGSGRVAVPIAIVAAALALAVGPASAAAQARPGRGEVRSQLERRIRARFAQIVREQLGLTDEQSRRLGQVVQGFQGDRRRLAGDENAARRQVDSLLAAPQASEEQARSLLRRMSDLREEEMRLSRREQDSLLEVLSPTQLLRFDVLREELGARIRRLRQFMRGPARPGGRRPIQPPPGTMPGPGGFF